MLQALLQLVPLFDPAELGSTYQLAAWLFSRHKMNTIALRAIPWIGFGFAQAGFVARPTTGLLAAAERQPWRRGGNADRFRLIIIIMTVMEVITRMIQQSNRFASNSGLFPQRQIESTKRSRTSVRQRRTKAATGVRIEPVSMGIGNRVAASMRTARSGITKIGDSPEAETLDAGKAASEVRQPSQAQLAGLSTTRRVAPAGSWTAAFRPKGLTLNVFPSNRHW